VVVDPSWRLKSGVAEEARTRGFAAQAFAWCAFIAGVELFVLRLSPAALFIAGNQVGSLVYRPAPESSRQWV